jgi:hypothetical protein
VGAPFMRTNPNGLRVFEFTGQLREAGRGAACERHLKHCKSTGVTAAGSKWTNNLVAAGLERGCRHLAFDPTRSESHSPTTTTRSNLGFQLSPRVRVSKMVMRKPARALQCEQRKRNCKSKTSISIPAWQMRTQP